MWPVSYNPLAWLTGLQRICVPASPRPPFPFRQSLFLVSPDKSLCPFAEWFIPSLMQCSLFFLPLSLFFNVFLTHSPCNTSLSLLLRDMSGSIICTTSQNQPRAQEKCCSRQTPAKTTQNPHAIYWQQLRGQAFALEPDFTSITENSSTGQFS